MTSSLPSDPTRTTCEERTDELIRKIKAISSASLNSKATYESRESTSTSSKDTNTSKLFPVLEKTSPSDTPPTSPIQIIYCAKTHPRSLSPPPKCLVTTFPCPPEIPFPNETKIVRPPQSPKTSNFPVSLNPIKLTLTIDANKELVDEVGTAEPRARGRGKRRRESLCEIQRTFPTRILLRAPPSSTRTRSDEHLYETEDSLPRKITVKLASLSVSKSGLSKCYLPKWLEELPEKYETTFYLESALEYRVFHADHPHLQDHFTSLAYPRLQAKMKHLVRNEVEWESLRTLWS
jgi:hypothetical protein